MRTCTNYQVYTYIQAHTGKTYGEIARHFDLSRGNARSIINKLSTEYPIFEEDGALYVLDESYFTSS
jgi:Mor family transcriptional regulator